MRNILGRWTMGRVGLLLAAASVTPLACGGSDDSNPDPHRPDPGVSVDVRPRQEPAEDLASLQQQLGEAATLTAEDFAKRYALSFRDDLGYDPTQATGLGLITSELALTPAELDAVEERGFAITAGHEFPTFTYGYATIYAADLPVYISADSILYAVHRSFDAFLMDVEERALLPQLTNLSGDAQRRGARPGSR